MGFPPSEPLILFIMILESQRRNLPINKACCFRFVELRVDPSLKG